MKLNPNKYNFGVGSSKFLDFLINERRIEANLKKIRTLLKMKCPTSIKEIQQLIGRVAVHSQFIFKLAEKYLLFFKVLKNIKNFSQIEECQISFEDLKKYLGFPSLLSMPVEGEELCMYIFISPFAVCSVLIRKERRIQKSIFYTSKLLRDVEIQYKKPEKIIYALIVAAQRLDLIFKLILQRY